MEFSRAATTGNITLSGKQTVDDVVVGTADLVLVKDQTAASENGLYVAEHGAWVKKPTPLVTTRVAVSAGTLGAGTVWQITTAGAIEQLAPLSRAESKKLAHVRTPFDYGAAGDGVADDTAAIQALFDEVFASDNGGCAYFPPGSIFKVTDTISKTISSNRVRPWGIEFGVGAKILSAIANTAKDVISFAFSGAIQVRHMHVVGLHILGQGGGTPVERDGFSMTSDTVGQNVYVPRFERCVFENLGRYGVYWKGNIFEGGFLDCTFAGCGTSGAAMENGATGIISSVRFVHCNFRDNISVGATGVTPVSDVSYIGCDFINNGSYGINQVNGIPLVDDCHFENNHAAAAGFVDGQGAIACNNMCTIIGCRAFSSGAGSKQANLLRALVSNNVTIIGGYVNASGGASAPSIIWLNGGGTAGRAVDINGVILGGGATITNQTPVVAMRVDGQPRPYAITTGRTLTINEQGCVITNAGAAGAVTLTLPASPRVGDTYTFMVMAAQNLVVDANTGQTIRIAGSTSTSGGTATNNVIGSILKIIAQSTTLWVAETSTGTWTLA